MSAGFVIFRLDQQRFGLRLETVREILRLDRLTPLPGMSPPMAGVLVVRGNPLPVVDLRAESPRDGQGDVLVIDAAVGAVGMAVDQVIAVLSAADLPASEARLPTALPSYVVGVRTTANGPILVVDPHRLLDGCAEGWADSLAGLGAAADFAQT